MGSGSGGHALKVTQRPPPQQQQQQQSVPDAGCGAATLGAAFEAFIGEAGRDPSALCEVDELVLERMVQVRCIARL